MRAPVRAVEPAQQREVWGHHVDQDGVDPNIEKWYVPSRQGRRFSGDLFPDEEERYRLDVGCYYSVCIDANGNDHGTLVNELNAYRDRDADFYPLFFDCMGPFAESLGLPRSPTSDCSLTHLRDCSASYPPEHMRTR